ncbi:MAG: serine hydrolase [Longimicrobiales bacterium]|nr:serine hydrolase [Longimicrobiales bacterium]
MKSPARRKRVAGVAAGGVLLLVTLGLVAPTPYPLDGYDHTGIRRLRAYQMMLDGRMPGTVPIRPGARLSRNQIHLRMDDLGRNFDVGPNTPTDSALQAGIERIVGRRHPSYRVAILDITDPAAPRYAAVRADQGYIPGSVGKLLVMSGLFDQLRRLYPDDVEAREELLRNTRVVAGDFAMPNSHQVPVVADDWSRVTHRAIRPDDVFTLWEWVDHMVSPSSNAAGSVVWREAMLMDAFGRAYPPTPEQARDFFRSTPRAELTERSIRVIEAPLIAAGIDPELLRIRTMFTRGASGVVPGRGSHSTPRALVRWMLRMEQGRLVDEWSSLEMKRLMYYTRRRYRYAFSPALDQAAVYFKSGSLYRCRPEEGFACGQYMGNVENLMHSVAIVESPAGREHARVYLISMMSNVLKVNSAGEHSEIATQIERLVASHHPEIP